MAQELPEVAPAYRRLSRADDILILRLHADGKTQADIAQIVGTTQATVSRTLAEYDDTTVLARATLRRGAEKLAERVVKEADVDQALEVLDRLEVAPKRQVDSSRAGAINILIGMPGKPAIEVPTIDLSPVNVPQLPDISTS